MKRATALLFCLALIVSLLAGCGDKKPENTTIESLPHSIPYYNGAEVEIIDVFAGKVAEEDHGRITGYAPLVGLIIDGSSIAMLSEDDLHWSKEDVDLFVHVTVSSSTELPQPELVREYGGFGSVPYERECWVYTYSWAGIEGSHVDFSDLSVEIKISVMVKDENSESDYTTTSYVYTTSFDSVQTVPTIQDFLTEMNNRMTD